jgi:hypothetical protein
MHGERVIPLVPRRRVAGLAHGTHRSTRRGVGSDLAGSRLYLPGDDVRKIDRFASARLSLALGRDEFVVQEHFAEEAAHVILVEDIRPSMRLFPPDLPWLSKPDAVAEVASLVHASAARVHCRFRSVRAGGLTEALQGLLRMRFGSGSFVFLVSDFLEPPAEVELTRAVERRWDVVPVVVQDATWEQSFPDVGGVTIRLFDPGTGRATPVFLTRRECRARREANESRLDAVLNQALDLGLDPVVISTHDRDDIDRRFRTWAETRGTRVRRR